MAEAEPGTPVVEICRTLPIRKGTVTAAGGLGVSEVRELEISGRRTGRQLVADCVDRGIVQEALREQR